MEREVDKYIAYILFLTQNDIATEEEIDLVCGILGHGLNTLDKILYYRTACKSIEEWKKKHANE